MPMPTRILLHLLPLLLILVSACGNLAAADRDNALLSLIRQKCLKCHGEKEVNGEVNFKQIKQQRQFLSQPKLIDQMIGALENNDMPPEGEPPLDEKRRGELVATLKSMLKQATAKQARKQPRKTKTTTKTTKDWQRKRKKRRKRSYSARELL